MYIISDDQWAKETGQYRVLRSQIIDLSYSMLRSYFNCPLLSNPSEYCLGKPEEDPAQSSKPSNLIYRDFIYNAVHRTRTPLAAIITAIILIRKLKSATPEYAGTEITPHRVMLSAIIISCKLLYDDTYSNKTWVHVSQNLFNLDAINRMEWEFCSYLEFKLTVTRQTWLQHTHDLANKLALIHGSSSFLFQDLNSLFVEPDTMKMSIPSFLANNTPEFLPTPPTTYSVIPMPQRPVSKHVSYDQSDSSYAAREFIDNQISNSNLIRPKQEPPSTPMPLSGYSCAPHIPSSSVDPFLLSADEAIVHSNTPLQAPSCTNNNLQTLLREHITSMSLNTDNSSEIPSPLPIRKNVVNPNGQYFNRPGQRHPHPPNHLQKIVSSFQPPYGGAQYMHKGYTEVATHNPLHPAFPSNALHRLESNQQRFASANHHAAVVAMNQNQAGYLRSRLRTTVVDRARANAGSNLSAVLGIPTSSPVPIVPQQFLQHYQHAQITAQQQQQQQMGKRGDSGTDLAAVHQHNNSAPINGPIGSHPRSS